MKDDGGAVGLTENVAALKRWMVSGTEMARVTGEFEASTKKRKKLDPRHHEEAKHVQKAFERDVRSLASTIKEMGNPFTEESSDLLALDNRDIADPNVVDTVHQIEKLKEQYDTYVKERLVSQTKPISDPIKKIDLPLFRRPPVREKTKSQLQVTSLRNDCSLLSRLYIASQVCNGNLDEFFEHKNQAYPPALSQNGKLRSGSKLDLVGCLEDLVTSQEKTNNPDVQFIILDGSTIVNMLRLGYAKKFSDYASQVFLPYIVSQTQHAS